MLTLRRVALVDLARRHAWPLGLLTTALAISLLPLALAACCAPAGASGLGSVWFINDFAQYESALRQGSDQPGWQIRDVFTAEPHRPVVMFPLYVGLGKLASLLHAPPALIEHLAELVARATFVLSLWRFCLAFTSSRAAARAACLLGLFGSGLEVPAGLLAAVLGPDSVYTGSWSYETNSFGLLFAAPHVPLAAAATLELARGWLRPAAVIRPAGLLAAVALGAALALLHPFHAPVLLVALAGAGLVFWRTGQGLGSLAGALAAAAAATPILGATLATFGADPFWSATYTAQNVLPSPAPHELVVDLGVTLLLVLAGTVARRSVPGPFGLSVWLLLSLVAMYLPVPYQRRLGFGLQPALAVLAGSVLVAATAALGSKRAAVLRLGLAALAASGTLLVLTSVVASGLHNAPLPIYRATTDLDAAASWLDRQARAGDVVLADWQVGNYLGPRVGAASVFGGHPVATLRATEKHFEIATLFAHDGNLDLARRLGVQWLVYGPAEASLPGPAEPAFRSGPVRVYRVGGS